MCLGLISLPGVTHRQEVKVERLLFWRLFCEAAVQHFNGFFKLVRTKERHADSVQINCALGKYSTACE